VTAAPASSVETAAGPVARADLGIVLPHEHLLIDLRNQFAPFSDPEKDRISREPVSMANLGWLRRNPYAVRDNLLLDDLDLAAQELEPFHSLGGRTVVDCTSIGVGRDPVRLRELADATGLNIIAGCGYYTRDTHPPDLARRSASEIADRIIRDLTEGIEGTGIRAGVIGEIGLSWPVHPDEWKVLEAAAIAHRATGAPVYVHVYPWCAAGVDAADRLLKRGVRPAKVVICHSDVQPEPGYMERVLERGVFLEFDNFGKEFWVDSDERGFAGGVFMRDCERVDAVRALADKGFAGQVLVANDVCLKSMLRAYGGWGYDHILRHVVPMMLHAGIARADVDRIVRENPADLLAG